MRARGFALLMSVLMILSGCAGTKEPPKLYTNSIITVDVFTYLFNLWAEQVELNQRLPDTLEKTKGEAYDTIQIDMGSVANLSLAIQKGKDVVGQLALVARPTTQEGFAEVVKIAQATVGGLDPKMTAQEIREILDGQLQITKLTEGMEREYSLRGRTYTLSYSAASGLAIGVYLDYAQITQLGGEGAEAGGEGTE